MEHDWMDEWKEAYSYRSQTFKINMSGGVVYWAKVIEKITGPPRLRGGGGNQKSGKTRKQSKLEKARKRSIASLATLFARLKKPPWWFITLAFDRNARDCWTLEECLSSFRRFRRYLERRFPRCWFIFVMEFSPTNGYHFHLSGRFGQKKIPKKALRTKWQRITDSEYDGAMHFTRYVSSLHCSYVTKKKVKASRTQKLMRQLGHRSFWGCIHRKQLPLARIKEIVLSDAQMEEFRWNLRNQIIATNGAQSSLERLNTDANRLCYLTPTMLKRALRAAQAFDQEG